MKEGKKTRPPVEGGMGSRALKALAAAGGTAAWGGTFLLLDKALSLFALKNVQMPGAQILRNEAYG